MPTFTTQSVSERRFWCVSFLVRHSVDVAVLWSEFWVQIMVRRQTKTAKFLIYGSENGNVQCNIS